MKIVVTGAFEGSLNRLYEEIKSKEKAQNVKFDLVIICGNFQAIRNKNDLKCVDCMDCWKNSISSDFSEYYNGKRTSSHLTLVIGGSQEASNYLKTLSPFGGWLAKNIFYMGAASVLKFNGLRIGGISGNFDSIFDHIYKTEIAKTGYFEHLPLDAKEKRSICYTRYLDVYRVLQLKGDLDIMFTYDWPLDVLGDKQDSIDCMKKVPFTFQNGDLFNDLGSPMYKEVLDQVKPKHWFAGKVNLTLNKVYNHQQTGTRTEFHSLNKFSKSNKFQIFEIESSNETMSGLEYDAQWLAILRATNQFVSIEREPSNQLPQAGIPIDQLESEEKFVRSVFKKDNFKIPKNFSRCEPVLLFGIDKDPERVKNYVNKQTTKFCNRLELTDPNKLIVKLTKTNPNDAKYKNKYIEHVTSWISNILCSK